METTPKSETSFEAQVREAVKAAFGTESSMSLYRLSKVSAKLGRDVRPQQLYRYRSEKLIKGLNADGTIGQEAAVTFLVKFVGKRVGK